MTIVIHVMRLPLLQLKTPLLLLPTIVGRAGLPLLRPSSPQLSRQLLAMLGLAPLSHLR